MAAIIKFIAIHSDAKESIDYICNPEKTTISFASNAINYTIDKNKTNLTDETVLVTPINCASVQTADLEWKWKADEYKENKGLHISSKIIKVKANPKSQGKRKREITCVHIIQSYDSQMSDPILCNKLGVELVSKAYPGFSAIVSTHVSKKNINNENQLHNHILVCAYNKNRKIQYNLKEIHRCRDISDSILLSYGMSVICSENKGMSYGEWKAKNTDSNSWKDELRSAIEDAKSNSDSWTNFKVNLRFRGYDIAENPKSVTYIILDNNHKIRDHKLGEHYTKLSLERFWSAGEKEIIETIKMDSDDDALIWKMVNVSKIKQPKINKGKYSIWVSYYDLFGRERSTLEILILIWLKTIFLLFLLFRDLLLERTEIYELLCQEYNRALETLEKLRLYEITSKEELKTKMNETGAEISHLKKQISEMKEKTEPIPPSEDDADRTERVASLIEFERLQELLKNKNMKYADLSKIKRTIEKAENPDSLFRLLKEAQVNMNKSDFQTKKVNKVTDMLEEEQTFEGLIEMEIREKNLDETEL